MYLAAERRNRLQHGRHDGASRGSERITGGHVESTMGRANHSLVPQALHKAQDKASVEIRW